MPSQSVSDSLSAGTELQLHEPMLVSPYKMNNNQYSFCAEGKIDDQTSEVENIVAGKDD